MPTYRNISPSIIERIRLGKRAISSGIHHFAQLRTHIIPAKIAMAPKKTRSHRRPPLLPPRSPHLPPQPRQAQRPRMVHAAQGQFEAELKEPMLAVIRKMTDAMTDFAPNFVRPAGKVPVPHLSRHRFSANKLPLQNPRRRLVVASGPRKTSGAGYYFHISAKEVIIAAGAYMPEKDQLAAIRHWLLDNHPSSASSSKNPPSARHSPSSKATRSSVRPRASPANIPAST
jgi:hypothetical protein